MRWIIKATKCIKKASTVKHDRIITTISTLNRHISLGLHSPSPNRIHTYLNSRVPIHKPFWKGGQCFPTEIDVSDHKYFRFKLINMMTHPFIVTFHYPPFLSIIPPIFYKSSRISFVQVPNRTLDIPFIRSNN